MTSSCRALHRIVSVVALPLLVIPLSVATATVHRARAPAAAPARVRTGTGIIALPLSLVVPAAQRLCTARTPSGLGYTILRHAPGTKPAEGDTALVNYIGYLAATGAVFDQGMRSALPVYGVIPGFSQGLQMMARTEVVRFCIPAAMGYGAQASGPIPANSDLVFQVELVDYKTSADVETMTKAQVAEPGEQKDASPKP